MRRTGILWLILLFGGSATAQVPAVHDGELALEFPSARRPATSWYLDYTSYDQQPAFRTAVHHFHAACDGYLYITPTRLVYVPVFSPEQKDAFDVLLPNVTGVRPRYSGIELRLGDRVQKFAFLTGHATAGVAAAPQPAREALLALVKLALSDFKAAQAQFAADLTAGRAAGSVASGSDAAPAAPRTTIIKVLAPSGVSEDKLVDAGSATPRIIGYAAAPAEIRSVLINNAPGSLRPLSPTVAEFAGPPLQLAQEIVPVDIQTSSAAGESHLRFKVRKAVVQWPHIPLETRSATYTLQGHLLGYGQVTSVDVDGHAARLQSNPDGSADFLVANLPLHAGRNALQGELITAQGTHETFPVTIERFRRLTLQDVKTGLQRLSTRRLLDLIAERGVDFPFDSAAQRELRAAGASAEVLQAVAQSEHE
jgi:hypothetical protein